MKLRFRFSLIFLAMLLSTLLIGLAVFWTVQSWERAATDLRRGNTQLLEIEMLRGDLYRLVKEVGDLFARNADGAEDFRKRLPRIRSRLAILSQRAQSPKEQGLFTVLRSVVEQTIYLSGHIFTTYQQNPQKARVLAAEVMENRAFPELEKNIDRLRRYYQERSRRLLQRLRWVNRATQGLALAVVTFSLVQILLSMAGVERWLVRPIKTIGRATALISQGDLGHRVGLRAGDELGELAQSVNTMAASLQKAQKMLIDAERMATVGEMATYVAHNLRNPLASIRSAAEAELHDLPPGASATGTLQDIIRSVDRLERWAFDLVEFARPLRLHPAPYQVKEVIDTALAALEPQIAERGLHLVLEVDPALPPVLVDATRLNQVLVAILTNAIEASPSRAALTVSAHLHEDRGHTVAIEIRDRGGGIPEQAKTDLFTPFFTTRETGTGLGLAMARKIVNSHGGEVSVCNAADGAIVTVTLPAAELTEKSA